MSVRFWPGGQVTEKHCLRSVFLLLVDRSDVFVRAAARGKNREAGSRKFPVREIICDHYSKRAAVVPGGTMPERQVSWGREHLVCCEPASNILSDS